MPGNFELQVVHWAVIFVRFIWSDHRFYTDDLLVFFNFEYFLSFKILTNFENWISLLVQEFKTICEDGTWTMGSITEVQIYLSHFWWLLDKGHNLILPICYFWLLSSWQQNVESTTFICAFTGSCHA
jgi:hypothetical protein